MLLGKRPRPPIRRTTSMTGITAAVDPPLTADSTSNGNPQMMMAPDHQPQLDHQGYGYDPAVMTSDYMTTTNANFGLVNNNNNNNNCYDNHERFLASMVLSPRNHHHLQRSSSSGEFAVEPAHFLRTCGLCRRRLASGRDIYMYRGDTAFCSQECREKRMKQDERQEKYSEVMATRKEEHHGHASSSSRSAKSSSKGETVAPG